MWILEYNVSNKIKYIIIWKLFGSNKIVFMIFFYNYGLISDLLIISVRSDFEWVIFEFIY